MQKKKMNLQLWAEELTKWKGLTFSAPHYQQSTTNLHLQRFTKFCRAFGGKIYIYFNLKSTKRLEIIWKKYRQ